MNHKITKIRRKLMTELDKDRYEHTLGVMYTAAALAMRYEEDIEKALMAGLLHDCAKCLSGDTKIKLCKKFHLSVSEVEKSNPSLLHAKLGAFLAAKKYHVKDKETPLPAIPRAVLICRFWTRLSILPIILSREERSCLIWRRCGNWRLPISRPVCTGFLKIPWNI